MMQYNLLSILTPFFYWNQPKNWPVPSYKTKSGEGGSVEGLKMTIWAKYFILHDYFIDFSAVLYLFEVKKSTFKS